MEIIATIFWILFVNLHFFFVVVIIDNLVLSFAKLSILTITFDSSFQVLSDKSLTVRANN